MEIHKWKTNASEMNVFSAESPKYEGKTQYADLHLIINFSDRWLTVFILTLNGAYNSTIHHSSTCFFLRYIGYGN